MGTLTKVFLHLWSKFAYPSLSGSRVSYRVDKQVIDTQTDTHTDTHTDAGNDNTSIKTQKNEIKRNIHYDDTLWSEQIYRNFEGVRIWNAY